MHASDIFVTTLTLQIRKSLALNDVEKDTKDEVEQFPLGKEDMLDAHWSVERLRNH